MKKRRIFILLSIFVALFASPALLLAIAWNAVFVGVAYALAGAIGLSVGWTLLWGTIDQKRVTALFGHPDLLAQRLALPEVPLPLPLLPPGGQESRDLNDIVSEEKRLPTVDLKPTLDALPKLPVRAWLLRDAGGSTAADDADYLALGNFDLAKELEHIDELRESLSPKSSGAA